MRLFLVAAMFALVATITGCGGGSSASPPSDVKVVAGDSSATVSWTDDPGVQYWVWVALGASATSTNCASEPGCRTFQNVSSPFIVTGLVNGTTYSITINARHDFGPGGPDSPPIAFIPRPAGQGWVAGAPLGPDNLLGVGFTLSTTVAGSTLVTVGANGKIFSSNNAVTWTAATSGVAVNLNAVQYHNGLFVAIGDQGTILTSVDTVTWTPRTSTTTNALYALTANGSTVVAVGAQGTILVSGNSTDWKAVNSGTTSDLRGAAFGNGHYVAVGANGTVVNSTDGSTWASSISPTGVALRAAYYGARGVTANAPAVALFVAVGASGTVITSADGVAWSAQPPIAANNLAGVAFGSQFIAVGSGGAIFTSSDGFAWQAAESGTAADLNAVTFTVATAATIGVGYAAVGNAGTNLTAF